MSSALYGGQPLIGASSRRVIRVHSTSMVGMSGLDGDILTFASDVEAELRLKRVEAEGVGELASELIRPQSLAQLVSTKLYAQRTTSPYYVEPVIVGLEKNGDGNVEPFLCAQDALGAQMQTDDFVVSGTCSASLYGVCEAFYEENMEPDVLWRRAAHCLITAMERDCLSGVGAVVHLMTAQGITTHFIQCSSD